MIHAWQSRCAQGRTWLSAFANHSAAMLNNSASNSSPSHSVMITVPISASDVEGVQRLARHAHAAGADVVEIRLDRCLHAGANGDAIIAQLPSLPLPVILTIRHFSEQGEFAVNDAQRVRWYHQAMQAGVAWIDVELAQWATLQQAGLQRSGATKLILSYHDFDGMGDKIPERIAAMRQAGADIAKIAVLANDADDLAVIKQLYDDKNGPLIAIAMGEHGYASRLLAGCFGAAMTFARLDGDVGSAPGQPSISELVKLYRIKQHNAQTKIYGIIGSPVSHSLSPVIHNTAFAHQGINAVYVPFRVENAVKFWRACNEWISGLSVTIPHKPELIGHMHTVEELVQKIGAMNTVYRDRDGKPVGANTDAHAVTYCLETHMGSLQGRTVLVLGAGGVARAIGVALGQKGAKVIVVNRTMEKAHELAAEVGATAMTFEQAHKLTYDVIINGTAVGMGKPDESPWPAELHRDNTVVFDTVYHPLETKLLRDAQEAGAKTVSGLEMLLRQALGQYQRWTGREAPQHLMYRACLDRLGATQQ
jgi:3-dehydroquinate dehydratase / shikimate dehydrogenase